MTNDMEHDGQSECAGQPAPEWPQTSSTTSWNVNLNNGNSNTNNRTNRNRVRPVCASSSADGPIAYDITLESLVEAFEDCMKAKLSSRDGLAFLGVYEAELRRLWLELRSGRYEPGRSKCFVVRWPVKREVFAADFADRVVHHWWALRVNPLLEDLFTEQDNVSKNCRRGEGTLKAVQEVQRMVDAHPAWWVGKFDFEGYFMNIDQQVLWEMMDEFLRSRYRGPDLDAVLWVTRTIIFHRPQDRCLLRSPRSAWRGIPPRKTLSAQPEGKGCAIGNLPSQLMANFYASAFDDFVHRQGITDYVRFVDDFVVVMPRREDVVRLIPLFRDFLWKQLRIRLHPKKIYVQPVRHGLLYVGAYIQPGRTYIGSRTRGRWVDAVRHFNGLAADGRAPEHLEAFVSTMNSYLGLMRHHRSYNIRKRLLKELNAEWWRYVTIEGHVEKVRMKKPYRQKERWRRMVRDGSYARVLMPEVEDIDE